MKQFGVLVLLVGIVFAENYPTDLPRCKPGDMSCINDVITKILSDNAKGHSGLNLAPYDPLRIKSLLIAQDPNSPVNIQLQFNDVDLTGISKAKVYKTVGFTKDPTGVNEVHAKIPQITLKGPYTVKGQVLILPITGSGQSTFTFENVDISLKFKPKVEEKNGQQYVKVTNLKFDMTPTKVISNFENLFNGDKALGDNMNVFMNENWKEVFGEMKPAITKAMAEILQAVINGPYSKIPYSDLYLPE